MSKTAEIKDEFLASPEAEQTDGVIIATTHSAHYEVGMKAIGRFHVLMEKPMTTDLAEADWLAQAASKSDHIFMLNNTANFRDSTEKVHNMVKSPCLKPVGMLGMALGSDSKSCRQRQDRAGEKRQLFLG